MKYEYISSGKEYISLWAKGKGKLGNEGNDHRVHYLLLCIEVCIFVIYYLQIMHKEKEHIREQLIRELFRNRVFWSYKEPEPDSINDDILIEKTLIHLDIEDINKLFILFPKAKVRSIWKERVVIRDARYCSMNLLFAYLYFNLKNPDNYLKRRLKEHYKQLQIS